MNNPKLIRNGGTISSEITLRDVFAAFALAGLWASPTAKHDGYEADAKVSYLAADAMLAEREKG